MVGGTPKPFACNHEGCTMTFTNEDHLNVHHKKHEMDLNLSLGNKPNVFVADQTPTPTRFLRNCEEVGLFQDLQNVNPFEETFRRAVELVKTGSLPEPDLPADDTLHTPHVFPLLTEDNNIYSSKNCQELIVTNATKSISNAIVLTRDLDLNKISNQEIFKSDNNVKECSEERNDSLQNNVIVNSHITESVDHDYALEISKNQNNINIVDTTNNPTKLKLKQVLLKNKKQSLTVNLNQDKSISETIYFTPISLQNNKILNNVTGTSTINNNIISIITPSFVKLPVLNTNPVLPINNISQLTDGKKKYTFENIQNTTSKCDSKGNSNREDILERNRAAALRCRQKRKKWINNLENNYEKVCKHNNELQKELINLRNEVLQLKTLLLAHKDCSVTKAMTMGERFVIDPSQILNLQITQNNNGISKKRLVLPKTETQEETSNKIKIRKLKPTSIDMKDISFVTTQTKKSVIVLNTAYSDLSNN